VNDLIPFTNGEFAISVEMHEVDGFRVQAPGLARALGHRDAFRLVESIPDDEKGYTLSCTPGGNQRVWYVTEAGFYRALGQRQAARITDDRIRESVTRFQSWVYGDVLPSLRKTGRYEVAERFEIPATFAEALELAAKQAREIEQLGQRADTAEAKVLELHPKADSWDTLADTGADYSCREAAYILNRDPAISTGQNRLLALLRSWKLIDRHDKPYANHSAHVALRPQTRIASDGDRVQAKPQVRVTVQGLSYLHKRLGGVEPLDFGADLAAVTP
jgi:anti-repressor protein